MTAVLSISDRRSPGTSKGTILLVALAVLSLASSAQAQDGRERPDSTAGPGPGPTVVQLGAPGEDPRVITDEERIGIEAPEATDADISFARRMIPHHAQALEMVELIPARTDRRIMRLLGRRISISQQDEIEFLRRWLEARGAALHADHDELMPGMLTEDEMGRLTEADGIRFEQLFLELMIRHHRGALTMVDQLLSTPGAAQESLINQFAAEVWADQEMEIRRMDSVLDGLREDELREEER